MAAACIGKASLETSMYIRMYVRTYLFIVHDYITWPKPYSFEIFGMLPLAFYKETVEHPRYIHTYVCMHTCTYARGINLHTFASLALLLSSC